MAFHTVVECVVAAGVIVGISSAIIVFIFMAQRFGTSRVGACFAPIVLIYFLCNLIISITNICRYNPTIFKVNIVIVMYSAYCCFLPTATTTA